MTVLFLVLFYCCEFPLFLWDANIFEVGFYNEWVECFEIHSYPMAHLFLVLQYFSWLSGASSVHLSDPSKIHPSTSFIVSHSPSPFYNFPSDIGSGMPSLVTEVSGKNV